MGRSAVLEAAAQIGVLCLSKQCRLCLDPGGVHCVTFAATPTMVHTFLESPNNLEMEQEIRHSQIHEHRMSKKAERSQPIIGYKKTAHTISGIWGIPGGAENHPPYAKAISSEHRHCLDKQSTPICAAASNTADRPIYKFLLLTKVRRRSRHPKQRNFLMWP